MPQILDKLSFHDRRKIGAFTVLMLSLTAFSFTQGTIVQQFMDLHLTAWPIFAVRNVFATIGVFIGIGFIKNWF